MDSKGNLAYNYICRPTTELPSYMWGLVKVPHRETFYTGEIYDVEVLDTSIGHGENYQVYVPTHITYKEAIPSIIVNGGFEETEEGRRPVGQPDYTRYAYKSGEIVNVLKLLPEIKIEISPDCLENVDEFLVELQTGNPTGSYLCQDNGNKFKWVKSFLDVDTKVYLYIEGIKWFRTGGNFGGDFAISMIARVKYQKPETPQVYPEIDDIQIMSFATILNLPIEKDSAIGRIEVKGGTNPFIFDLGEYSEYFRVEHEGGYNAIIIANKEYYDNKHIDLNVNITDINGKTKTKRGIIQVQPSPIGVITMSVASGLKEGNTNVRQGASIITMSTGGQNAPFVYSFNSGDNDNNKFIIEDNKVKVGNAALTAGTYRVSVKSTDRYGQTTTKNAMVVVAKS